VAVFTGETYNRLVSALGSAGSASDIYKVLNGETPISTKVGGAAAVAAMRFGKSDTEGLEIRVVDEVVTLTNAVETNLTNTVPAGSVILAAMGNLQTAITGDGTGDDLGVKVGIGVTADPDKYGISADLSKNTKIDWIHGSWAKLGSAETVCVKLAKTDGTAATEKFTAGGKVRVVLVYLAVNSLDDAA
jgi:hypothetical protein